MAIAVVVGAVVDGGDGCDGDGSTGNLLDMKSCLMEECNVS